MYIKFINKNYNNEKVLEMIEKKLGFLTKHLSEDTKVIVKLDAFGKNDGNMQYSMEVSFSYKGKNMRAKNVSHNMSDNIDEILKKTKNQMNKVKVRNNFDYKFPDLETSLIDDVSSNLGLENPKITNSKLVKVKNFSISIITVEQAVEELEYLDHNFYVFVNAEDNKVSIVYRRQDGGYGLITPEY